MRFTVTAGWTRRAVIVGLLAWPVGAVGAAQGPAPKVVIPSPAHDLGILGVGAEASHEFVVRNEGDAPLLLGGVQSAREVTVTGYERSIAPGETARVRVAIDTLGAVGPTSARVAMSTNDPAHPKVTLELTLHARHFVLAEPGYARYIVVQGADEGTISQTLWATDGADFRVIGVDVPDPFLRVFYREALATERWAEGSGRQWRVEVTLASTAPVGSLSSSMTVRLDHPKQKRLRIPVSGFVRPMFAVTPATAQLGDIERGRLPASAGLVLKSFHAEPVELHAATTDVPGIRVEIVPVERGRTFRLRVVLEPTLADGPFAGTIQVRTSNAKRPTIEVPLSGRIVSQQTPAAPAVRPAVP